MTFTWMLVLDVCTLGFWWSSNAGGSASFTRKNGWRYMVKTLLSMSDESWMEHPTRREIIISCFEFCLTWSQNNSVQRRQICFLTSETWSTRKELHCTFFFGVSISSTQKVSYISFGRITLSYQASPVLLYGRYWAVKIACTAQSGR